MLNGTSRKNRKNLSNLKPDQLVLYWMKDVLAAWVEPHVGDSAPARSPRKPRKARAAPLPPVWLASVLEALHEAGKGQSGSGRGRGKSAAKSEPDKTKTGLSRPAALLVLKRLESCEPAPADGGVLTGKGVTLDEWEEVKSRVAREVYPPDEPEPIEMPRYMGADLEDHEGLVWPEGANGRKCARTVGGEMAPGPVKIDDIRQLTRAELLRLKGQEVPDSSSELDWDDEPIEWEFSARSAKGEGKAARRGRKPS